MTASVLHPQLGRIETLPLVSDPLIEAIAYITRPVPLLLTTYATGPLLSISSLNTTSILSQLS